MRAAVKIRERSLQTGVVKIKERNLQVKAENVRQNKKKASS